MQTFMTWISGAYIESFFEGGGEHLDISSGRNQNMLKFYFRYAPLTLTEMPYVLEIINFNIS